MKNKSYLLRLTFAVVILSLLIYKLGFKQIFNALFSADLIYSIFIIFIWIILLLLGAYNLFMLLKASGVKMNFRKLFKYYLLSWSAGLFFPGKAC